MAGENASTTNKGIASFNSSDFGVSSGVIKSTPLLDWQYTSFSSSNIPDTGVNISIGQITIPSGRTGMVLVQWSCQTEIETADEGMTLTTKRDATAIGNTKDPFHEDATGLDNVFPSFTHAQALGAGTYTYTINADPTSGNNNSDIVKGDCTIVVFPIS